MTTTLKFAQKAFVLNERQQMLFLKRSASEPGEDPCWDIPGGGLEFGEAPEAALRRELSEEVNLCAEEFVPLKVWSFQPSDIKQVVGVTYLAKGISGELALSHEHSACEWIDLDETLQRRELKVFHNDIRALLDYLQS